MRQRLPGRVLGDARPAGSSERSAAARSSASRPVAVTASTGRPGLARPSAATAKGRAAGGPTRSTCVPVAVGGGLDRFGEGGVLDDDVEQTVQAHGLVGSTAGVARRRAAGRATRTARYAVRPGGSQPTPHRLRTPPRTPRGTPTPGVAQRGRTSRTRHTPVTARPWSPRRMVHVPAAPNRGGWLQRRRRSPMGVGSARPVDPGWGRPADARGPGGRPFGGGDPGLGPFPRLPPPLSRTALRGSGPRAGPPPYPRVKKVWGRSAEGVRTTAAMEGVLRHARRHRRPGLRRAAAGRAGRRGRPPGRRLRRRRAPDQAPRRRRVVRRGHLRPSGCGARSTTGTLPARRPTPRDLRRLRRRGHHRADAAARRRARPRATSRTAARTLAPLPAARRDRRPGVDHLPGHHRGAGRRRSSRRARAWSPAPTSTSATAPSGSTPATRRGRFENTPKVVSGIDAGVARGGPGASTTGSSSTTVPVAVAARRPS